MKRIKLTYEITLRAGDYQSIKIGGEWSVDADPTPADIANIDTELRQQVEVVLQQRKADAEDKRKAQAEQAKAEQPKSEQAQADAEDKRELVTTSKADEKKLKAILKKIQDGVPEETVRKFFRFDDKAEMLVKIALQDVMRS